MRRIVELPSINPASTTRRQGLRKLSPDLISKARDETATQVTRVGLTFVGTAAFCLLSLLSPDSALLGGREKINVPFAGPVSFFGFLMLGPTVLIVLRVYLQIYVEHSNRLDRLARSVSVVRAPTLVPLQNSLIWLFGGLIFYVLLPVTMMLFGWKAAVFPAWGSGLFSIAAAVIASHSMLPFSRLSWRSKGLLSVSIAIIAGGVIFGFGPLQRPFDLYRANLSGHWLLKEDLHKANLRSANLSGANLGGANLSGAHLSGTDLTSANLMGVDLNDADLRNANLAHANLGTHESGVSYASLSHADLRNAKLAHADLTSANLAHADLSGADLSGADLTDASLWAARLTGTNLSGANLSSAHLIDVDLRDVKNLTQTQLDEACASPNIELPKGFIAPVAMDWQRCFD